MKILHYALREFKDVFEYFLIPILVVLLPHNIYYPIFKFICSHTFFYANYSKGSYKNAQEYIVKTNSEKNWTRNVKLLYLIDISDLWLAWLRPRKFKNMIYKKGNWQHDKGFIALTPHWGTGMLSLVQLKSEGLTPYFVYSSQRVGFRFRSFIEKLYRNLRRIFINKISDSVAITTGGGYETIINTIHKKGVPVILYDAPRGEASKSKYSLFVFGKRYPIASGFINMICSEGIPYQLYSVILDFETGKRTLRVNHSNDFHSHKMFINELSNDFQNLLLESPEQWFLWRQSLGLFEDIKNE